jgi:hypothetical protein
MQDHGTIDSAFDPREYHIFHLLYTGRYRQRIIALDTERFCLSLKLGSSYTAQTVHQSISMPIHKVISDWLYSIYTLNLYTMMRAYLSTRSYHIVKWISCDRATRQIAVHNQQDNHHYNLDNGNCRQKVWSVRSYLFQLPDHFRFWHYPADSLVSPFLFECAGFK